MTKHNQVTSILRGTHGEWNIPVAHGGIHGISNSALDTEVYAIFGSGIPELYVPLILSLENKLND